METVVSTIMDKFGLDRRLCCAIVLGICLLFGIPSSLGYSAWAGFKVLGMQILDLFDFVSNSVMMPILAFITCIFVGYILKPRAVIEEIEVSGKFTLKKLFVVMIRYVAPVFLIAVLASSVLDAFGIIKI
jgi:NSS family neurotransmitter:Na+ symporter